MDERIRKYIDGLFADAPKTRKAMEWKEEVVVNTIDKYHDLISEGYNEEDAWQIVINSIGDVTELFEELREENPLMLSEEERKKRAVLNSVAAGLYIFAGVVYLLWMLIAENLFYMYSDVRMEVGLILAALICIPPTCILIYTANMYPNFSKKEDSLVEACKEARYIRNRERAIKTSVSAIIWLVTLILYFIISFVTYYWNVTWIIFLVGGCAQAITFLVFSLKRGQ
ncbi:MAG TPA: hypothetical protein DCZ91_14825 [Lachnospiraceae bacterium]|nr:hypothetical protein [Lachnospiraceae bacterium]